jgi:predicted GTPase
MTVPKRVTLAVTGQTGAGKSALLNAYLQRDAFEVWDNPQSCTGRTSASENLVLNVLRTGIDTQGLDDTKGIDEEHVQQMVAFLKEWDHGVNVFAIVINVHADRFDQGTQKLVKLLHQFFNNPRFWNQVCIVFTKCFAAVRINKEVKKNQYREQVLKLVRECQGPDATQPQLPVFFVDSPAWATDQETKDELTALHTFVYKMEPLPTHDVVAPDTRYLRIERETQTNILVNTEVVGDERIQTYEDQEREKRTAYDGKTITYSDWTATRRWDNRARSTTNREEAIEVVNEKSEPILAETGGGGGGPTLTGVGAGITAGGTVGGVSGAFLGGVLALAEAAILRGGQGGGTQVVGQKVTKTFRRKERLVTKDFDGNVSYGDWHTLNEWTE